MGGKNNCTHLAGEYLVAGELSKRGYNVGITMGNAKGVDIVAEREGKTVSIEVKTVAARSGWRFSKGLDEGSAKRIYVFVTLNPIDQAPHYFVATGAQVKRRGIFASKNPVVPAGAVEDLKDNWQAIEKRIA